jgi:hypothetical protein
MTDAKTLDVPASLARTRAKIEQWRARNRPRAQIPPELWREAAEVAQEHGLNRTAKVLRLDYYSLKKRAAAARPDASAPAFVELLRSAAPVAVPEFTIEIEDGSGAKMRIRLQGADVPDLAALARAFREGGR